MNNELIELRKKIIERDYSRLNSMQFRAVTEVEGPLLILAGAGSGKTTVIVNRIACLIKYGSAYTSDKIFSGFAKEPEELFKRYLSGDSSVYEDIAPMLSVNAPKPWQILAITFTNKAASEMKERLVNMLGDAGNEIWASTFHAACVRILRREADKTGFSSHFTIYDTDDQKRLIKDCMRQLNIDEKFLSPKTVMGEISRAKDELISPEDYKTDSLRGYDPRKEEIKNIYSMYQNMLKNADAMDFDDIIVNTVKLLSNDRETLEFYQNRFRYILVDEYQDTNHAQYVLVSLLAGGHKNICVVGDDDQSIYSFRGATIENILSFEKQFDNAKVIRLEENYRSTTTILDAANSVIANNSERKGKNLWTSNGEGSKIELHTCSDEMDEGRFVADTIIEKSSSGKNFSDFAVLYRTNAQSNNIERSLVRSGIPYRVIGGRRFYDRKEIRDAIAYLSVVTNHNDSIRLRRIINEPKRGIGETTMNNVTIISSHLGESVFEVMKRADEYSALSRSSAKLKLFTEMIETFSEKMQENSLADTFRIIMNESGYIASLSLDEETKEERTSNLDELYSTIARYEQEYGDSASMEGFLEEVALLSDIDNYDEELDTVILMTLHAAKGLEFPVVFLVGMENGLFPSSQSIGDERGLEEERRLAYVGITRAKSELLLTKASQRMQYGKTAVNPPSVFLEEIPKRLINDTSPKYVSHSEYSSAYSSYINKRSSNGYSAGNNQNPKNNTFVLNSFSAEKKETPAPELALRPGDSVRHKKFGDGLVVSAEPIGNDVLLQVAFNTVGTKKLMQKAARLEKI
ncbi:MAG: UvrD-helicase domain-containing protein [Oscillospiraceae bacterium]|nr:UvrD-helicase domain-containing protein [Oscillospiraceae bacterium]